MNLLGKWNIPFLLSHLVFPLGSKYEIQPCVFHENTKLHQEGGESLNIATEKEAISSNKGRTNPSVPSCPGPWGILAGLVLPEASPGFQDWGEFVLLSAQGTRLHFFLCFFPLFTQCSAWKKHWRGGGSQESWVFSSTSPLALCVLKASHLTFLGTSVMWACRLAGHKVPFQLQGSHY